MGNVIANSIMRCVHVENFLISVAIPVAIRMQFARAERPVDITNVCVTPDITDLD